MSTYRAAVDWRLAEGEDFAAGRYGRGHDLAFEGGHTAPGTASRHVVGKWARAGSVDPEEMLVASLSACHMLTFLHKARLAGFVVTRYRDEAEGVMEEIEGDGRMAITRVLLRPRIAYKGRAPSHAERERLHHEAHEDCFIANSVKTEVMIEEQPS